MVPEAAHVCARRTNVCYGLRKPVFGSAMATHRIRAGQRPHICLWRQALLWLKDLALVLGILYLLYRDLLMRLRQPLPCEPTSAPSTAGTADGDKNISTLVRALVGLPVPRPTDRMRIIRTHVCVHVSTQICTHTRGSERSGVTWPGACRFTGPVNMLGTHVCSQAEEVLKKWDKALTMRDRRTSSVRLGATRMGTLRWQAYGS